MHTRKAPVRDFLLEQLLATNAAGRLSGAAPPSSPMLTPLPIDTLRRRIGAARAEGKSFSSIAALLNAQGHRGRYGGRWYASSVRRFFTRQTADARLAVGSAASNAALRWS